LNTLAAAHRETLRHVCETFLPGPVVEVVDLIEETFRTLPPAHAKDLARLFGALERAVFVGFSSGTFRRFSALNLEEREALLLALSRSRIPKLRKGFQALKRLACFYHYARPNPDVAREVGYQASPAPPARAPRVQLTPASDLECDACIVGSGAGGGVIAAELSAAGMRVVVLEAARGLQSDDFTQQELQGMKSLYLQEGRLSTDDLSVTIVAGSALGGGTAVNWQTSFRTPDHVRAEWARNSGCAFFTEPSFDDSLQRVLDRLHVGTNESEVNANNDVLRRGCERLGYRWSVIPRNARGCAFDQCGYCAYGCRAGGKQSTTITYLRDAVASGNCRIITGCNVERIDLAGDRVQGVSARVQPEGQRISIRAPLVICAAGGIESPALLLRSGIRLPAVGRHLHLHPTSCVAGFYDEPIKAWHGAPQSIVCDEFADISPGYGARLETAPTHPGLFALAIPWHGRESHRAYMRDFAQAAAVIVLTRDHAGGRVWVNRAGFTVVDYRVGDREVGYLNQGIAAAARVHAAAGANRLVTMHSVPLEWKRGESIDAFCARLPRHALAPNWSPVFSAHQMGSCRMGAHADAAVCNENGAVYGVKGLYIGDGSALPGSCGVNPMITIMALAHHTAQHINSRHL
jgi:choline dehydrogenase-like flavoprotein